MTLRTVLLLAVVWMALVGCAEKLICPAYQSSFIHDKEALRQKFSYFVNDSTPKVFTASASKNKYLIAEPESYRKRYRKMQTVELRPVQPVVPDSLIEDGIQAELDSAARSVIDSIAPPKIDSLGQAKLDSAKAANIDSTYVITKDREVRILRYNFPDSLHYDSATGRYRKEIPKYFIDEVGYNAEQELYMWYFRKQLILPDVRLSKLAEGDKAKEAAKEKKKGGFFKKLMFWKKDKKKAKSDSLQILPPPIDPHDSIFYTDSASLKPKVPVVEPKKKGVKSLLKRKEKPAPADPNKSPAKKEEDGF
jgi:hypothetical protein